MEAAGLSGAIQVMTEVHAESDRDESPAETVRGSKGAPLAGGAPETRDQDHLGELRGVSQ